MSNAQLGKTPTHLLFGIIAGLVSALLFGLMLTGFSYALFLVFLIPIPLFIAGLGWGAVAAIVGGLAGTGAIMLMADFKTGLLFALPAAFLPAVLSYLALISRPGSLDQNAKVRGVEWYPEGRLVLWTALLMAAIVGCSIIFAGVDEDMMKEWGREFSDSIHEIQTKKTLTAEQIAGLDQFKGVITSLAPHFLTLATVAWTCLFLMAMALAAWFLEVMGLNIRTWAPFNSLEFPKGAALGLAAAALLSFMPGQLGLIGDTFMAALMMAFCVLGMATFHGLVAGRVARVPLLFVFYIVILFFPPIFLFLLVLGLAEHAFAIRARFARPSGGPRST